MTTEAQQIAIETENLRKLERFLSSYETAAFLVDCVGPTALATATRLVGERRDDADSPEADDNSPPTLAQALRNTPNSREKPPIVLGSKSALGLHGKQVRKASGPVQKDNSSAAFSQAGNAVTKARKALSDSYIDQHRGVNWVDPARDRAAASKVKLIKDACRKSREIAEGKDPYKLNPVMENILHKRLALQESANQNNTPAAQTIRAHSSPSESSVRAKLPSEFRDDPLSNARRQKDVNDITDATTTKRDWRIGEVANKITPTIDNSYSAIRGRMKSDTTAGKTIDRGKPDFSKSNPHETAQGKITDTVYGGNKPPRPTDSATNVPGQDTYKEPFQDKNREGQWPADPANPWYPEETASNRKQMTRW